MWTATKASELLLFEIQIHFGPIFRSCCLGRLQQNLPFLFPEAVCGSFIRFIENKNTIVQVRPSIVIETTGIMAGKFIFSLIPLQLTAV